MIMRTDGKPSWEDTHPFNIKISGKNNNFFIYLSNFKNVLKLLITKAQITIRYLPRGQHLSWSSICFDLDRAHADHYSHHEVGL